MRRGQIPSQRVHWGDAGASEEAETQPHQDFQHLPGEAVAGEWPKASQTPVQGPRQEDWLSMDYEPDGVQVQGERQDFPPIGGTE